MAYFTNSTVIFNMWGHDSTHKALETVTNNKVNRIIYCAQWEWEHWNFGDFEKLVNYAYDNNIRFEVINGSMKMIMDFPLVDKYKLFYFPESFILRGVHQFTRLLSGHPIDDITKLNYKYHFISLNRVAHHHRAEMMDLLCLNNVLDNNAISWHNVWPYPYKYKFWKPVVKTFSDGFGEMWNTYTIPEEYYESFAQLVIESNVESIFITEKTVKPLFMGKPFLVAGGVGFHKCLEQLGFLPYTEIFDYSFDNEPNQTLRLSMIADNFRKLNTIPLSELQNLALSVKEKVEYNKKLVKNIARDLSRYPKPIKEIIDIFESTGEILDQMTINDYQDTKKILNT